MSKYVRVSDILNRLAGYEGIDPKVLEAKAQIGTRVHHAIVMDQQDAFYVPHCQREEAYIGSYMMWRDINKPKIKQVPRLFDDQLMITGECDGLWTNPIDGPQMLIDWKCSATANKKIWNMQAHFYWYLLHQNNINVADTMLWINLRHEKSTVRCDRTDQLSAKYTPKSPIVYEFKFDENVLAHCIYEANRFWDDYHNAKDVDYNVVQCYS